MPAIEYYFIHRTSGGIWQQDPERKWGPVVAVALIVVCLLVVAGVSAVAAYRWSGSAAWEREYNQQGMGLSIELTFLFLTVLAASAISLIMADSFRSLFLERMWRSPAYLASAVVVISGVAIYMLVVAPQTLARKQGVKPERFGSECWRPYALYAPFSVISWVGFVLPVLALIFVSIQTDYGRMNATRQTLAQEGEAVIARIEGQSEITKEHSALYSLAYRGAIETLQRIVSRYLWVIGVFMMFLIVILNTRITSVFTEESQDAFKWLMWILLAVALGICLFGLTRFQSLRDLAIEAHTRIQSMADVRGQLQPLAASNEALLVLRNQGPVEFWRMTLNGGGLWLMFFSYASQIVMAKLTRRSLTQMIFPRPVARYLDAFMLTGEEPKP